MQFVKMHGTGNDFVLVDAAADDQDWSGLAVQFCNRHFGIGADGLIAILPSSRCDVRMRMFNPDGSEAEMCGNGIRCLARHAVESGQAHPKRGAISVETLAGDLRCELQEQDGAIARVRVAMGRPRLQPSEIPVASDAQAPLLAFPVRLEEGVYPVTCVSMGNPHAVYFSDMPVETFPLAVIGPRVEHNPSFPRRVNFEVVNVIERGRVRARVWERGAGETLACGTGACAIGVATRLAGLSDGVTAVELPGGELSIEWDGAGDVYLSGPAAYVFRGEWLQQPQRVPAIAGGGGV